MNIKMNCFTGHQHVNKLAAIARHTSAIKAARGLLTQQGNEPAFYAWHEKTIAENARMIREIEADNPVNWG